MTEGHFGCLFFVAKHTFQTQVESKKVPNNRKCEINVQVGEKLLRWNIFLKKIKTFNTIIRHLMISTIVDYYYYYMAKKQDFC